MEPQKVQGFVRWSSLPSTPPPVLDACERDTSNTGGSGGGGGGSITTSEHMAPSQGAGGGAVPDACERDTSGTGGATSPTARGCAEPTIPTGIGCPDEELLCLLPLDRPIAVQESVCND